MTHPLEWVLQFKKLVSSANLTPEQDKGELHKEGYELCKKEILESLLKAELICKQ